MSLSRKTRFSLTVLFLAAVVVRVAAIFVLDAYDGAYTYEHGEIAENLLEGRGFRVTFLGVEGLTSQQAPLYPAFLAAVYWAFGVGTDAAHLAMQLMQSLAGAAIVPCVFFLTRSLTHGASELHRAVIPWVAAVGAAVYPTHVYMVTHLQVVVWAAFVLAWLAAECFSRNAGSWGKAVRLGVLSGVLLLIDPILALALPFLAIAFWLRARRQIGDSNSQAAWPILRPAVMALVAAGVVSPWVVRNYHVHGEFVFVKSTFGYAFWQGNNPDSWGTDKIPKPLDERPEGNTLADQNRWLAAARSETLYIDDVLLTEADYAAFAQLSELERSRALGDRARGFIAEQPDAYFALCLRRLRYFFWLDDTNPKAGHPLYIISTTFWLTLLALGLFSLRPGERVAWLTLAIVLAVGLFHAATISSARFRLPIEVFTFPWCAAGACTLAAASVKLVRRPNLLRRAMRLQTSVRIPRNQRAAESPAADVLAK